MLPPQHRIGASRAKALELLSAVRIAAVVTAVFILVSSDAPWRWRWPSLFSEHQSPHQAVCTPIAEAGVVDYSDVFSYRMRTPDMVATLVLVKVDAAALRDADQASSDRRRDGETTAFRRPNNSADTLLDASTIAVCHQSHNDAASVPHAVDFDDLRGVASTGDERTASLREHLPSTFIVHGGDGVASDLLRLAQRVVASSAAQNAILTLNRHSAATHGLAAADRRDAEVTSWLRSRIVHREPLYAMHPLNANRENLLQGIASAGSGLLVPFAAGNLGLFSNPSRHPRQSVANFVYVVGVVGTGNDERSVASDPQRRCRFVPVAAAAGLSRANHGISQADAVADLAAHPVLAEAEDREAAVAAANWLAALARP